MGVRDLPVFRYFVKRNRVGYIIIIFLIVILGTLASVINWHDVKTRAYNTNISRYYQELNQSKSIITDSLGQYSLLLDDGTSLLTVNSDNLTQTQWLTYFQSYNLTANYPGVDGVNFAEYVTADQLPDFLNNMTSLGQPNFTITPSGQRSVYVPTTYIGYVSPVSLSGMGLDQLSNPVRSAAIIQAINSGNVTMSGEIASVAFHKGQPAFLIYKPIYDGPANTIIQRQSSIYGFVYVGIDSDTFFNTLLSKYIGQSTAVQVFDSHLDTNNLLYETPGFTNRLKHIANPINSTVNVAFGGRTWYIRVITAEGLIQAISNQSALTELLIGIAVSIVAAGVFWYFTFYRDSKLFWEKQLEVQSAKDELLSLASHQLRTPATIVKQYLGVMLQNYSGNITKEQRVLLQTAYDSNEKQLEIANQFLDAARLDSGRITLTSQKIVLNNILKDVVSEQQKIAKTYKQKIIYENPKRQYSLKGDPKYLPIVFENILSNAIKYSKESTKITVSLHRSGDNLNVTITDKGMGIAPEEQLAVFDKFSRASNEDNAGKNGTGIGLYLAKEIVDLHGGDIKVKSTLGKGSEFTVILPVGDS